MWAIDYGELASDNWELASALALAVLLIAIMIWITPSLLR
jgi:membrane protein YdbS with pleckstrin-like domain